MDDAKNTVPAKVAQLLPMLSDLDSASKELVRSEIDLKVSEVVNERNNRRYNDLLNQIIAVVKGLGI